MGKQVSAASYVGRIGGLALALGVGAAVFTGSGIACAQTGGTDSSTSDTSSSATRSASDSGSDSDSGTSSTGASTSSQDATASESSEDSTSPEAAAVDPDSDAATEPSDADSGADEEPAPEAAEPDSTPDASSDGSDETPAADTVEGTSAPDTADETDETDEAPGPQAEQQRSSSGAEPASADPATSDPEADRDAGASDEAAETPAEDPAPSTVSVEVPQSAGAPEAAASTQDSPETTSAALSAESAATAAATKSRPLATLVKKLFDAFAGNSPWSPAADSPFAWVLAAASRREFAGTAARQSAQVGATANPTMVLNGYYVMATGDPLNVGSYYGMFTNFPGYQGVVQGEQEFDLVDPKTGETVGSFRGLVSQNNSVGSQVYTEIVVTEVSDEGLEGTGAGELPPVGSVLASLGTGRYGTVYSAMPGDDGENDLSFKYVSPFGTFNLFTAYDAAKDLTDFVSFNRPLKTADGFYLAPTTPDSAEWMSVTGFPPFFTAIQGRQIFSVYDSQTNEVVGSFEGLVTVTSDAIGTYTEAVYVTETLSGNVGTAAGDTPPVGTVYNVIYFHSDDLYVMYSAKPSTTGNVISTILVSPLGVAPLDIDFDAATPPERESMRVPGAYTFVPTSDVEVVGINGLPPREAILQGYRQFDVFGADGSYLGSVDADVTTQWDVDGSSTEAILVTNVRSGNPGVANGDVPPVGSVFNFDYAGFGFGQAYYALPSPSGNKVVSKFVTPFGSIPMWTTYDAAKGMTDYDFYNPFANDPEMAALSAPLAAAGATAGLLGAAELVCLLDAAECETAA